MFSNKTQKLLALQNDYIERINKNAVKLDKQLNFLMDVQNHIAKQMGGALGNNPSDFPSLGETTQAEATAREQRTDNEEAKRASKEEATSKRQALMDKLQANTDQKSVQILEELRNIGTITKKGQVKRVNELIEESKSIVAAPPSPVQVEADTQPTTGEKRDGQSVSGATEPVVTGPDGGVQPGPGTNGARQQTAPSTDADAAAQSEIESQEQRKRDIEARLAQKRQEEEELRVQHEKDKRDAEEAKRIADQKTQDLQAQRDAEEAEQRALASKAAQEAAQASIERNKQRLKDLTKRNFATLRTGVAEEASRQKQIRAEQGTDSMARLRTGVEQERQTQEAERQRQEKIANSLYANGSQVSEFQTADVYNQLLEGMITAQVKQTEELKESLSGLEQAMSRMKQESLERAQRMAALISQGRELQQTTNTAGLSPEQKAKVNEQKAKVEKGEIDYTAALNTLLPEGLGRPEPTA